VLVAEGRGQEMMARKSPRSWRRVSQVVEFGNLTVADVQVMGQELCLLDIPPVKARQIHEHAQGGVMWEVLDALGKIERVLTVNPGQELSDKVLELALRGRKAAG